MQQTVTKNKTPFKLDWWILLSVICYLLSVFMQA